MIQYFLHGGRVGIISESNERFFRTLLEGTHQHVNILIILFARDRSLWEEKYLETQSRFQGATTEKILHFELAQDDIEVLRRQIRASDIIFIHGGDTQTLQHHLERIPDLERILDGKRVAGSSAGALVFSKYYYENDTDTYHRGLGLLDCGMICHWDDQAVQMEHIRHSGDVDEVLCISEGSFITKEEF